MVPDLVVFFARRRGEASFTASHPGKCTGVLYMRQLINNSGNVFQACVDVVTLGDKRKFRFEDVPSGQERISQHTTPVVAPGTAFDLDNT
jgi:hypothetical protein